MSTASIVVVTPVAGLVTVVPMCWPTWPASGVGANAWAAPALPMTPMPAIAAMTAVLMMRFMWWGPCPSCEVLCAMPGCLTASDAG